MTSFETGWSRMVAALSEQLTTSLHMSRLRFRPFFSPVRLFFCRMASKELLTFMFLPFQLSLLDPNIPEGLFLVWWSLTPSWYDLRSPCLRCFCSTSFVAVIMLLLSSHYQTYWKVWMSYSVVEVNYITLLRWSLIYISLGLLDVLNLIWSVFANFKVKDQEASMFLPWIGKRLLFSIELSPLPRVTYLRITLILSMGFLSLIISFDNMTGVIMWKLALFS